MTDMRVIFIPADLNSPLEEFVVPDIKYPAFNELLAEKSKHHDGDVNPPPGGTSVWVERVTSPWLHSLAQPDYDPIKRMGGSRWPSVSMLVDEEGRLKGLPVNRRATLFYGHPYIAGDALLVGDVEEDFTGLPEDVTITSVDEVMIKIIDNLLANSN